MMNLNDVRQKDIEERKKKKETSVNFIASLA